MDLAEKNSHLKLKIFLFSLVLPVGAYVLVGDMRLTAYRVLLLVVVGPCFFNIFCNKNSKILKADLCVFAYSLWLFLSLIVNHNFILSLESGGILVVESFGAYLFARNVVKNIDDYEVFVGFIVNIFLFISVLAVFESLTEINIFRPDSIHSNRRFGFIRAIGPFQHAILLGVFCSSIISLSWFYYPKIKVVNIGSIFKTIVIVIGSASSISSGAVFASAIQFILIFWNYIFCNYKFKWRLLFILFWAIYAFIDLLSNRSPLIVILHRLTFSAHTAYTRVIIWKNGIDYNVINHPFFGIGFNEWTRPSWLSASIDNFWLATMIRHGLPPFVFLIFGILSLLYKISKKCNEDNDLKMLYLGWSFSILSLVFAGSTVHFWNQIYVWFFFLLGAGGWMAVESKTKESIERN